MTSRKLTVRFIKRLRRGRRQVEGLGLIAGDSIDRHLIYKFGRLLFVKRFVITWLLIFILSSSLVLSQLAALNGYYTELGFVPGGTYNDGILGDFTTASPLYATNPVDSTVSHLIFSSLFTYNDQNQLVGDLAQSWSVDATGKVYTVQLKPNLYWQDGQPLTASDVAFTYHVIQNPDAQSSLQTSWQGVSVQAVSNSLIRFTLIEPLSSFPYSLTNGIVPEHILKDTPMQEMRSSNFNTEDPVGSGPFIWKSLAVNGTTPATREEQIVLEPSKYYYGTIPKLSAFIVDAYHDQNLLDKDFRQGSLTAIAGLTSVPTAIAKESNLQTYSLPLTGAEMVFFKTSTGILADATVRQALVKSVNINQIIQGLGYPVIPVREPLLINQLGYNPAYNQITGNTANAIQILEQDGWTTIKNGVRYKNGQPLRFGLYADSNSTDSYVTNALAKQWRAIGVDAQITLQDDTSFQDTVTFHTYDALLYGISIGVDPDVFVYWDSSQANPQSGTWLNLSEYKSSAADQALESGRAALDPNLRVIKYVPFLQAWQNDAPALGLYQPRLLYITREPVSGLVDHTINSATDLYDNVVNWEVQTGQVTTSQQ